ncbi:MAG: hypothetical protein QXT71_06125, partial [Thermoplasmata archaeon]
HQDVFPQTVNLLYVLNHPLRFISSFLPFQGHVYHSFLQSLSYLISFLALTLLFNRFIKSPAIASTASAIFHLSGNVIGLAQHTASFEAWYSLFISLIFLLNFLECNKFSFGNYILFIYFASRATLWYHEFVYYPMFYISFLIFLILYNTNYKILILKKIKFLLVASLILVILNIPTIIVAYEMSLINKSYVGNGGLSYGGFPFLYSLFSLLYKSYNEGGVIYGFNYSNYVLKGDPTVSYNYIGVGILFSLSLFFKRKSRIRKIIFGVWFIILFWFLFSLGSQFKYFYEFIGTFYPVILKMRHSYYGLKFLYFYSALATAITFREIIVEKAKEVVHYPFLLYSLGFIILSLYLTSDPIQIRSLIWEYGFILILITLLFLLWKYKIKNLILYLLFVLPLVMNINRTKFSPSSIYVNQPIKQDIEAINKIFKELISDNRTHDSMPKTVISFGAQAPAWFMNFLYKHSYSVLSAFDSQGNRFLENQKKLVFDNQVFEYFNNIYEVDYLWQMPVQYEDKNYTQIFSDPFWGGIFKRLDYENFITHDECHLSKKNLVSKKFFYLGLKVVYTFQINDCKNYNKVLIPAPVFWLKFYEITNELGKSLEYKNSIYGKISIENKNFKSITVQYPNNLIFIVMALSILGNFLLVLMILFIISKKLFFKKLNKN